MVEMLEMVGIRDSLNYPNVSMIDLHSSVFCNFNEIAKVTFLLALELLLTWLQNFLATKGTFVPSRNNKCYTWQLHFWIEHGKEAYMTAKQKITDLHPIENFHHLHNLIRSLTITSALHIHTVMEMVL